MDFLERRDYKRVNKQINVRIGKEVHGIEVLHLNAKAINISANGLYINIKEPLEVKDVISVSFLIPNSFEILKCPASVVRTSKNDDTYYAGVNLFTLSTSKCKQNNYYIHR